MAEKRLIGSIIASVLLSVTITGGLSYFALPIIFPSLDNEDIDLEGEELSFNRSMRYLILQEIFSDSITAFQKIPNTQASITIQNNSRISVSFNAMFMIVIDSAQACAFNISIVVNGYGNQTYSIVYYRDASASPEMLPVNFHGIFVTDPLPQGTYLVEVYWKSYIDKVGDNYLWLNALYTERHENPRTLMLLELVKNIREVHLPKYIEKIFAII